MINPARSPDPHPGLWGLPPWQAMQGRVALAIRDDVVSLSRLAPEAASQSWLVRALLKPLPGMRRITAR